MKPGTRILFSNEDTQDHAKSQEPFWGTVKDTIVEFGSTAYLTVWSDETQTTIVRPRQIEMIED